jgi:predicted transcriptional regulator
MKRDDVIRMAREAGCDIAWADSLERFAALVAAAECERACRIVTGLCISDNNAREINEAIREGNP